MSHEIGLLHSNSVRNIYFFDRFLHDWLWITVLLQHFHIHNHNIESLAEHLVLIIILGPKCFLVLFEFGEFRSWVVVVGLVVRWTSRLIHAYFENLRVQLIMISYYFLIQSCLDQSDLCLNCNLNLFLILSDLLVLFLNINLDDLFVIAVDLGID